MGHYEKQEELLNANLLLDTGVVEFTTLRDKVMQVESNKLLDEIVEISEELGLYDKPSDAVNHPKHYTEHPSGVECIQITEHMNFCLGNAIKYIWRAGLKNDNSVEDLEKAIWYLNREIKRLNKEKDYGIYD